MSKNATQKNGLIGRTLSHSLSPEIHERLYRLMGTQGTYGLFETEPDGLGDLIDRLERDGFTGVNVTIPYKTDVIPHLCSLSPEAEAIGAVNTIHFTGGQRIGLNTDYFGLQTMLAGAGIALRGQTVVVLGTGGAARCAAALAQNEGAAQVLAASRHPEAADAVFTAIRYGDLEALPEGYVLLNATPAGMSPRPGVCPVPEAVVEKSGAVVDMVYNPEKTRLLALAELHGRKTAGGLSMLVAQAVRAQEIWTGKTADASVYEDAAQHARAALAARRRNIVLIGMPGSGKSAVGRALAARLRMPFTDTDAMVEAAHGSIPDIFAQKGEPAFRQMERKAAEKAAQLPGSVISTGGGMVLSPGGMTVLAQTGIVFFIDRPLPLLMEDIDISGRPLLAEGKHKLAVLAKARMPLYTEYADFTAANTADIETCTSQIIKQWEALHP